jgi:hypothetical protein
MSQKDKISQTRSTECIRKIDKVAEMFDPYDLKKIISFNMFDCILVYVNTECSNCSEHNNFKIRTKMEKHTDLTNKKFKKGELKKNFFLIHLNKN